MKETEITAKLVVALRKIPNTIVLNLHGHAMQSPGWPDLYISSTNWSGWIECKGAETRGTPLQYKVLRSLFINNVHAYFLTFEQDNTWAIDSYDDYVLGRFTFPLNKWQIGAQMLMERLEDIKNGLRNDARVSN